ncbi:MAG: LysR family transcriptional regulator [Spirochaetaceae bacterium]|jgi:lysyl-tRNA synthetase class 2|nr:LysR family transcriptional regulator [Spirochaetaceae bacterium]
MDLEMLRKRAAIIQGVRRFFDGRGYLEVDTPLLAPDLIPESCLEVFKTTQLPAANSTRQAARDYWLVPSPEIWMKKLIAEHRTDMYQICKCFRNCESWGSSHSPEFTMLEYYTMDADYTDSLGNTEDLFEALASHGGSALAPPFVRWTMDEAFTRLAGFSLTEALKDGTLPGKARGLGLDPPDGASAGDIYNLVFIHAVEPRLPRERPLALLDYPAAVPCLAKLNTGDDGVSVTRQRWELYVRGIELANCYSEETDADAARNFFLSEQEVKNRSAAVPHEVDGDYWKIFLPRKTAEGGESPFPRCSGVALGLDRLIMALTERKTIDGVLPFPMAPLGEKRSERYGE